MTGESFQRRRCTTSKDDHHSISKEPVFWNGITAVGLAPFSPAGSMLPLAK
jgi:hypothetical protein